MLTTELKKSGANDVVVQGKLILNISSNISNQSINNQSINNRALQAVATSHQRTPSVISAISSNAGSSVNRNSMQPSPMALSPSQPNGATAPAPIAVPSTAANGRQLSPYEDQNGPLPPK